MAVVPVPGSQLTAAIGRPDAIEGAIPAAVRALLESLWSDGQAAYVVGGSLRDVVLGRTPGTTGTSRRTPCPSGSSSSFPGAVYENKFGTVGDPA